MAQDPYQLVYQGKEGTGAAMTFGQSDTRGLEALAETPKADKQTNEIQGQLQKISAKAPWDIDKPYLDEKYDAIVEKLKVYESTKDKNQKQQMYYDINKDIKDLQWSIDNSIRTRQAYVNEYQKFKSDQTGAYNQDETEMRFIEYADPSKYNASNRPAVVPGVQKATKISAIESIAKRVQYNPKTTQITTSVPDASGTKQITTVRDRTLIDDKELKQSIKAILPHIPQNERIILNRETRQGPFADYLIANNIDITAMPEAQQQQLFDDFVVNEVFGIIANKYKERYKDADITKTINKNAYKYTSGGLSADGVLMTLQKTNESDGGTYRIQFAEETKSGAPKATTEKQWVVSGSTLLALDKNARINGEQVEASKNYYIRGRLKYLQVNADDTKEKVLGVELSDIVSSILKKGTLVHIPLTNNEADLRSYVSDWKTDVFDQYKTQADDEYKSRMTKKRAPVGKTSTSADRPSSTNPPPPRPAGL